MSGSGYFYVPTELNYEPVSEQFLDDLMSAMCFPISGTCPCGEDPCGVLHFWVKVPEQ